MKPLVILALCFCIKTLHARPTKQEKRHKKYVIEVQDHQQAMKYADPMIDLEETVRRGINDPLNNQNFVMNGVNEEYFHRNFVHDTSIYGGALPRQSIQTSMHSSASVFDLTPQRAIPDNAVKNSLVANHISPFLHLKSKRPIQENARKMETIPSRPAPLIKALRSLLLARKNNKINNLRFFTNNNIHDKEKLNPLTGLPEDLESNSYGAITSIESVSDQPEHQQPETVTVNINSAAVRRNRQKPVVTNRRRITPNSLHMNRPKSSKSSSVAANTIGSNYDSIQSFLEADDILRKNLSDNNN